MASETLTLALEGRVTLAKFAGAIAGFRALVESLSSQTAGRGIIEWEIADLRAGSATMTVAGLAAEEAPLEQVVQGFESVGEALRNSREIPYGAPVRRPAQKLVALLDGAIHAIRFETANKDVTIVGAEGRAKPSATSAAHGVVEGRVQTLSSRAGLRFTLYDRAFDAAVSCYVERGSEDQLRNIWDSRAAVEGWVTRDRDSGRPLAVRHIKHVERLAPAEPDQYIAARGVAPLPPGAPDAVAAIRKLRNAWRG